MSTGWYLALLGLVALERLAELIVSTRNARRAMAMGGVESGQGHYPAMVALHTGLLVGCLVEVIALHRPFLPMLGWPMLALVVGAQVLRWWCITTLGVRWNTRVIVIPGLPAVASGPYRFVRHPNYVAVAIEVAVLPLVHCAWVTALAATVANALLLAARIRHEERALASAGDYRGALVGR